MKKVLVVLALLLVPGIALAVPTISFDTTPGGAGGTLTYDGLGGPLVGTGIVFVDIVGQDTPQNNNILLDCVGCSLAFITGTNVLEGPSQWTWNGGGSFILTGTIPSIGINAPVALVSGQFTGTPNTPGLASSDSTALFVSLGTDKKNATLAGFYGLGPDFTFANTEIALGTFDLGAEPGSFTAIPNQADLINTAVPEPATLLLLGSGLVGAGAFKRRMKSQQLPV